MFSKLQPLVKHIKSNTLKLFISMNTRCIRINNKVKGFTADIYSFSAAP